MLINEMAGSAVGIEHYLLLSCFLFCLGMIIVMIKKNVIVMLMGIELMLNAVNLSFLTFSYFTSAVTGQIFVFFTMTIAAAEAGVGLAIVVSVYKRFKTSDARFFEMLKG